MTKKYELVFLKKILEQKFFKKCIPVSVGFELKLMTNTEKVDICIFIRGLEKGHGSFS